MSLDLELDPNIRYLKQQIAQLNILLDSFHEALQQVEKRVRALEAERS